MADYFFRDDIEAEKDRQAKATENTLTLTAPTPAQAAPKAVTAPAPAPGNSPYAAIGQAASQAKPAAQQNPFDAFRSALDAQDPFKARVKQGVSDTLANPAAAADEAAGLARDRLAKSQQVEAERRRQAAGMAYGGAQTGQVGRAMDDYATEAALQTQDADGQLRAERLAAIERNRNAAIGQGTALIGQEEQAKIAREQMAQNERMQGQQLASTEKLAYAGLDLEKAKFQAADANAKQGLSLDANAQALQKLGMDREEAYKYASLTQAKQLADKGFSLEESAQALQKLGMDQQNAQYYAGLAQQQSITDKEIASREKLAYAQIGSQEKLQAADQLFQGEQAKLNRELEKLLSTDRIQAQLQLADLDRQFQEKMQTAGFVQEKDLEAMRADLQTKLQDRGIQADAAKQIADQKFAEMMAGRDQAFQAGQADLQRAWQTGERVDSQTWEASMKAGDQIFEEKMAKLNSLLRLDEAQNAQAFQSSFQQMQNSFTLYRDQLGYDYETATRLATQDFQESMQQAGFSQEAAMQGAQLAWQANESNLNRASQEMMAAASLAQQDEQFMAELQQRYQFRSEDLDFRRQELEADLKLMGLQGQQLEGALQDRRIQNAMQIAALGMEISDGSSGAMAPFVEQLGTALQGYMKEQGIDITQSDFVKAMTAPSTAGGGLTAGAPGTAGALEAAQSKVDQLISALPAKVNPEAAKNELSMVAKGSYTPRQALALANMPGAATNVWVVNGQTGIKDADKIKPTQAAYDYLGFQNLVKLGIPEKTAGELLSDTLGAERFKTSYKALTGKDWA